MVKHYVTVVSMFGAKGASPVHMTFFAERKTCVIYVCDPVGWFSPQLLPLYLKCSLGRENTMFVGEAM